MIDEMAKTKPKETSDSPPSRRNVEVSPAAMRSVHRLCDITGYSQKLVVERVLEWIAHMDRDTIGAITGGMPMSRRPDFARLILEEIAKGGETEADRRDHDSANRVADEVLEPNEQPKPDEKPGENDKAHG